MNAETGAEAESPKKRGRIPQSAWPQILERYRGGATLSAIAREFECTPSAISYIIRKAEAAGVQGELTMEDGPAAEPAPAEAEPAAPAAPAPAPAAAAPAPAAPVKAEAEVAEAPAPAKTVASRAAEGRPVRQRLTTRSAAEPAAAPAPAAPASATPAPAAATAPAPAQPAPTETLRLNRPDPQPTPQPVPVAQPAPAPAAPAAGEASAARPAGARPEPTPPVDAVEGRLRDTAKACISAYRSWRQQPSESSIQSLSDTVHELRKALARIEIDMSASRREEQAIRPIPIPAHRASRRPQ